MVPANASLWSSKGTLECLLQETTGAQYYGVSFNNQTVDNFIRRAVRLFFKWMNRRSQKRSMSWEQFNKFMELFPPPKATVRHPLF